LVLLRITIGWHFLYEGVWKIANRDTFSAEPFLTQAKGPFAPIFFAMVPDLDGKARLQVIKEKDGRVRVVSPPYETAWERACDDFISYYNMDDKQSKAARQTCERFVRSLQNYLAENQEAILAI